MATFSIIIVLLKCFVVLCKTKNNGESKTIDWDAIKSKIRRAKDGDIIKVNMLGETRIPASVLELLKGKNVTLELLMDNYNWSINGDKIGAIPSNKKSYDMETSVIADKGLSTVAGKRDILQIGFVHSGGVPFEATLGIKVDKKYIDEEVYLYCYNEQSEQIEYAASGTIDKRGNIFLNIEKALKHVITTEILKGTLVKENPFMTGKLKHEDKPIGDNWIVPFYMRDSNRNIVSISAMFGDLIHYIAPATSRYNYTYNVKSFEDISGHWSLDNIEFVLARELFNGINDNQFAPDDTMTRGMLVTGLGRLSGIDIEKYKGNKAFFDVDLNEWYAPYVAWAAENRIVEGIGDNRFAPNAPVTREQMALIITNYAKTVYHDFVLVNGEVKFSDSRSISPWAVESVKSLQRARIILGKPNNLFDPQGLSTRAEVCTVLKRLIEAMLNK